MHFPDSVLRLRRSAPWVCLLLVFLVSLPAVTVRFYASDEIEYFAYLRSMWFDGDLSFDNEYRYFYDRNVARAWGFKETFLDGATATGLRTNFAPVGSAILWAPFYAAADAGVRVANAFGAGIEADGFAKPYIGAVVFASASYGFLALLLSAYAAARVLGDAASGAAAAFAVWLGTPLLFYMYLAPGFSHATSAFAVAAFAVLWLHVRQHDWRLTGVAGLGAMAALMGMVREQDLFIAVGPGVDFLVTAIRRLRAGAWTLPRVFVKCAVGAAAGVVCFLPQLWAYVVLFGRPGPSPTVQGKMTWTSPHAWLVLGSPDNGWFFWTPLAILAVVGLIGLTFRSGAMAPGRGMPERERAWIGAMCLLMVTSQIYVAGSLDTWAGAGSFGQRRLIGLTIFMVLGLAALFAAVRTAPARYAARALVVVAVWWNVGLAIQYGTGLMDRRRLDPAANAYNNFVTVPLRLPDLVRRFFTDRESFYQVRSPALP